MTGRIHGLSQRARNLDTRVLGQPVADERSTVDKVLRPRPAVWSRRGRVVYGAIVIAMFAAAWWLPEPFDVVAVVVLLAGAFLVVAADERRRQRSR